MKTISLLLLLSIQQSQAISFTYTFRSVTGDNITAFRGVNDWEYEQGYNASTQIYDYLGVHLDTPYGTYGFSDVMNHEGVFTLSADRAVMLVQNIGCAHMSPYNFEASFHTDEFGVTSWCARYLVFDPKTVTDNWFTTCGTGIFLRSDLPFVHEVSIASPDSGQTLGLLALAFLSVVGFYKQKLI